MIVQKRDGAYLYATTDLATLEYRREHFKPDEVLYVVDTRQSEHFDKLFAVARHMGSPIPNWCMSTSEPCWAMTADRSKPAAARRWGWNRCLMTRSREPWRWSATRIVPRGSIRR